MNCNEIELDLEDESNRTYLGKKLINMSLHDENLTKDETKVLRKHIGKLDWLVINTRLDISRYALDLAKKQKKATLKHLRDMNKVLKKVHEKESRFMFRRIGNKEDLCVIGVCDASYHNDDNSVGGEMIMLGSKKMDAASSK